MQVVTVVRGKTWPFMRLWRERSLADLIRVTATDKAAGACKTLVGILVGQILLICSKIRRQSISTRVRVMHAIQINEPCLNPVLKFGQHVKVLGH